MLAHAASSRALPCRLVSRASESSESPRNLSFQGKTGGFAVEGVGFELGARWFEARGLLESGESAYQPIQKLTGP